jgi:hypothetical protein
MLWLVPQPNLPGDPVETILDYDPTPFELEHMGLGYSEDGDPLTAEELRAEILKMSELSQNLRLYDLFRMRDEDERALQYLLRLPPDDGDRRAREEYAREWPAEIMAQRNPRRHGDSAP